MPLFSIIVPVYKVEIYIRACVESVLLQSFKDWELILVDDASPDECPHICDDYAAKDARVKVVHLENNSGLSAARNAGIRVAIGEYFLFLDSDDFYIDGNLKVLSEHIQLHPNEDVIFLSFRYYHTSLNQVYRKIEPKIQNLQGKSSYDILFQLACDDSLIPQVGTKLIKANFLLRNELFFKDDSIYVEDWDWTHNILSKKLVCGANDVPHYMYRVRANSLTSRKTYIKRAFTRYTTFVKWSSFYENVNSNNREPNLYLLSKFYGALLGMWVNFDKTKKLECRDVLKKHRWIMRHSNRTRIFFIRIAYALFGFTVTAHLLHFYSIFRSWQSKFRF